MVFGVVGVTEIEQKILIESVENACFVHNIEVTKIHFFDSEKIATDALLRNEVEATVLFLNTLSTKPTEGICIGALLPRLAVGYTLCVPETQWQAEAILRLPQGAEIAVMDNFEAVQLSDFRSDFRFLICDKPFLTKKQDEIAFLCPNYLLSAISINNYRLVEIETSEFVPPPAQATIALEYRKYDMDTEAVLRILHDKKTLRCSNIERGVQRLMGDSVAKNRLGVYCKEDKNGYYHASVVWIDKAGKAPIYNKISQNTRHNLSENIIKNTQITD